MISRYGVAQRVLLAFFLLASVQCGKNGKSSQVSITISPKTPVVILSDYTYDPDPTSTLDDIKVTGPWFAASFAVSNKSDETITIQSLTYTAEGISEYGVLLKSKGSFTPDDVIPPSDPPITYLAEVPAGTTQSIVTLFIGGLPKNTASTSFYVNLEIVGWFGTALAPTDKLSKTLAFSTK